MATTLTPTKPNVQGIEQRRFVVVYQAGIANLFQVDHFSLFADRRGDCLRIYQGDFRGAELIARGLGIGGHAVRSAYCNQAGDVAQGTWDSHLADAPFSDRFHPVHVN